MKNLKKLFCVIVSFILMMCSALPTYASSTPLGTYDSQIVNTANQYADLTEYSNTDLNPFISANGGRYFTVEEPEKDHFEVDVGGGGTIAYILANKGVDVIDCSSASYINFKISSHLALTKLLI